MSGRTANETAAQARTIQRLKEMESLQKQSKQQHATGDHGPSKSSTNNQGAASYSGGAAQAKRALAEDLKRSQEERKAAQQKQLARLHLQDTVERLQEALNAERAEKQRLRGLAGSLRSRIESIRSVCGVLEQQKTQYETFSSDMRRAKDMRSPEMLAPDGSLTFARPESEQRLLQASRTGGASSIPLSGIPSRPDDDDDDTARHLAALASSIDQRHAVKGRSSKRTAYCTDYGNQRYLGIREADAKEEILQRVRKVLKKKDEEALQQQQVAADAEGSRNDDGTASLPAVKGKSRVDQQQQQQHLLDAEYRGLAKFGYHGADSRIHLGHYKKRSSGRTKVYRDYNGTMLRMDSCDWPSTEGVQF